MQQSIWAVLHLRDDRRGYAKQRRAVAATHHVPRRALRTLHRWHHRCHTGWHLRTKSGLATLTGMLASRACALRRWLAVIGRAASPSEKTARANIVPQVRDGVKRPVPGAARAGCHAVRTARSWRRIVPFTHLAREGAYDSHHRTAGIAGGSRWRGGHVAARVARAADGDAGDWVSEQSATVAKPYCLLYKGQDVVASNAATRPSRHTDP